MIDPNGDFRCGACHLESSQAGRFLYEVSHPRSHVPMLEPHLPHRIMLPASCLDLRPFRTRSG